MDLSIIIVSWNVRDLLRACLRSVAHSSDRLNVEVFVVDNASHDGSEAMVREKFPWVKLIQMGYNAGFARANNRALGDAKGKYVLILNPDTEVTPNALAELVSYMDQHPKVGLVGPQIINPDGSFQQGSVRRNPTLFSQVLVLLKLRNVAPWLSSLKRYHAGDFDPMHEQPVQQVMGAAMCLRMKVLEQVGWFDEGFFLWFEEVDVCSRLQELDIPIMYYPVAKVIHHGGQSFVQELPLKRQMIFNRSLFHYFYKHQGWWAAVVLALIMPINLGLTFAYHVAKRPPRKSF